MLHKQIEKIGYISIAAKRHLRQPLTIPSMSLFMPGQLAYPLAIDFNLFVPR